MQTKILEFLRSEQTYLSGEEISRQLNISRAGIWKNIEELRRCGYVIEAIPHRGYKLKSVPDKLFPEEIQFGLKTKFLGQKIIYNEAVSSTMDEALRLGLSDAPEGTLVCAETQTKGRGRQDRRWVSPKGKGLYFSVLLRPKFLPTDVAKLTLLSAVAVCEAIKEVCAVDARIKWPNDVLIDGEKVCGILTEMNAQMDRVSFVVVGIGINVNSSAKQLIEKATSLKIKSKKQVCRRELLRTILHRLEHWYVKAQKENFDEVISRWKELSSTLGRKIRITDAHHTTCGEAVGLNEFGGLIIRQDDGQLVHRMSGDLVTT